MSRRHWAHIIVAAAAAVAFAAAAPAAASEPAASGGVHDPGGPAAAATAYLRARAAAITNPDPAAVLSAWVVAGSPLARAEARLAAGTELRGEKLGRSAGSADCRVTVLDARTSPDGATATVTAHAITTIDWRSDAGDSDVEASGVDHALTLVRSADRWLVTTDVYADDLRPACLEAASASRERVQAAARALERAASPLALPLTTARRPPIPARRYSDIISYDRASAQAYADAYALSYNPTFVRFAGADCANFASQCARAGDMPQALGTATSGWWYDKDGSSSPTDDSYSLSWINVVRQMGFWNMRRTDWETSAGVLSRGDYIYYDWSGDGVWDHVAVVAGTNSAGQKIIDAHTTDHYHVYWKLGYAGTKYRFAHVRAQWVV